MAQAILPNHWHAPPHSGNSAKSLAKPIMPNHWHAPPHTGKFCQITGTLSTCRLFCQITGTGNSAKPLACSSTYWIFCQISGTLSTDRHRSHLRIPLRLGTFAPKCYYDFASSYLTSTTAILAGSNTAP